MTPVHAITGLAVYPGVLNGKPMTRALCRFHRRRMMRDPRLIFAGDRFTETFECGLRRGTIICVDVSVISATTIARSSESQFRSNGFSRVTPLANSRKLARSKPFLGAVYMPRRGNNDIAQGKADAAPRRHPRRPGHRTKRVGPALTGRNNGTKRFVTVRPTSVDGAVA